jgi:Putative phage abortive infection protein
MKIPLPRSWLPLILVGLAFVAALVVAWRYVALLGNPFSTPPASDSTQAAAVLGQLGDYFGGLLNPIVSFLTLIVAVAVWRLQKAEMHETQIAFKKQAETAEQQRVQQRFFDLLNLYHRTVDTVQVDNLDHGSIQGRRYQGKAALTSLLRQGVYGGDQLLIHFQMNGLSEDITGEKLKKTWHKLGYLDHYFRAIYRLLKESEPLLGEEHFRYVKLLRAQLSQDEVSLLGLNMWLDEQGQNMLPLAEKYGILKHLPKGHLRTELEARFPPLVFGRSFAALQVAKSSS